MKTDTVVNIPLHPALAAVLATLPRDRSTFLAITGGAQRSANGLGNQMRTWCDAAGLLRMHRARAARGHCAPPS
jgi:hypothetical protein